MAKEKQSRWCKTAILGLVLPMAGILIFVLGVISNCFGEFFGYVLTLMFIAGLILSIIALRKMKHNPHLRGHDLAYSGMVITLLVLAISVLIFLMSIINILTHESHGPSPCQVPSGFGCYNYSATPNGTLKLTLGNNMGSDISNAIVNIGDCTYTITDWLNGGMFLIACKVDLKDGRVDESFNITYVKDGETLQRHAYGIIIIRTS